MAELDDRYTREWRGHPSWNLLRALGKRSQLQRRAFEPVSALRLSQEERAGRAGAFDSFGRSQSISQLLNINDSSSLFLRGSEHQSNVYASTYNCSCAVSSLRERQRCTRPTPLPAQHVKQKGPGALSTV